MLRAGALFYAIIISLILALVSSSLVMYGYLNNYRNLQYNLTIRLQDNANSGIQLLMSDQTIVGMDEEKEIDLFDTGRDVVRLKRRTWGAFEVASATALGGNQTSTKVALLGYELNDRSTALYLTDNNRPISICGYAKVIGTAYLPVAGTKRAYIEGKRFTGNAFVEGEILRSKRSVPKMNDNIKRIVSDFINGSIDHGREMRNDELNQDTISQSFTDETLIWSSTGDIELSRITLIGNIVVTSDKSIYVAKDARLKDVILAAPKIYIEEEFKGSFQAYASEGLEVGERVEMYYPTILGLMGEQKTLIGSAEISVDEGSTIEGVVFAASNDDFPVEMRIEENTKIKGQLYSQDKMQLRGEVIGSVICDQFFLKTTSAFYKNHLLDAKIDITSLAPEFAGINMSGISENKILAKWLH